MYAGRSGRESTGYPVWKEVMRNSKNRNDCDCRQDFFYGYFHRLKVLMNVLQIYELFR